MKKRKVIPQSPALGPTFTRVRDGCGKFQKERCSELFKPARPRRTPPS